MNGIKDSINRNGLLSKKISFKILNEYDKLLIDFFSFLWHKIIVLKSNMFIYAKVGNSKFVEMHGDASEFYRSALIFYTWRNTNSLAYINNKHKLKWTKLKFL
jgi:hypothetical protein